MALSLFLMKQHKINKAPHASASIITQEEEKENDKLRIKRKFNFKSSTRIDTNSGTDNQSSTTNQLVFCPAHHQLALEPRSNTNFEHHKTETSSINTNTQIENKELMNEVLKNKKLFFNEEDSNSQSNEDCLDELDLSQYNKYLSKDVYITNAIGEKETNNPLKLSKGFVSTPYSKRIMKLFLSPNPCEVGSIGLLDDEYKERILVKESLQFKFIAEVKDDNEKICLLPITKITTLPPVCLVNVLSFIYEDYDSLVNSASWFREKMLVSLSSVIAGLISQFKWQYNTVVDLVEYYYESHTGSQAAYSSFDLIIKARVAHSPSQDTSFIFRYCYRGKTNEEYAHSFVVDIRKSRTYPMWFVNESEVYHNRKAWFSYSQSVHSLCYGDTIAFRVNLFSKGNSGISKSFTWLPLLIENHALPKGLYEKKEQVSSISFDQMRHSEIENMVRLWKREPAVPCSNFPSKDYFMKIYSKHFEEISIFYDDVKPSVYKITMKADKLGQIARNNLFLSSIEIIREDLPIEQECLSFGLLSVHRQGQRYQIRRGTRVVFYFIDV